MIVNYKILSSAQKLSLERIFFENSKRTFNNQKEKIQFREKWLSPYMDEDRLFFAKIINNQVAGYINGGLDSPFLQEDFISFSESFPAHLHINIEKSFQRNGLGHALLERLCLELRSHDSKGVHIVTSPKSMNVNFYRRNCFTQEKLSACDRFLFMGRKL